MLQDGVGHGIQADAKDRVGLHQKLDSCMDPMDPERHPDGSIINMVSRKLAPASVNVDNAVIIGQTLLEDFEKAWPERFHCTQENESMTVSCKSVQIGDSQVYDLNAIYSRVMVI